MLSHLHIRDFTIVRKLDLEFGQGMTALTGETGAGKSILLDALGLALGDRAAADTVRTGAEKAEICVTFDLTGLDDLQQWLVEHDLDADDDCIIRRVIQANGRSKGYINGSPAPMALLRDLGEQLVDIHGQHEHQSLMKREMQRALLDTYGDNEALLEQVRRITEQARGLEEERRALTGGTDDQEARKELLRYQVAELEALQLEPESIAELEAEHRRLANAGSLIQSAQQLVEMLYEGDPSAQGMLAHAQRELENHLEVDRVFAEVHEMISNALVQLEEGVDTLRRHADGMDIDPARLDELEQQLATLSDLARKHHVRPEELHGIRDQLGAELADLENADSRLLEIDRELQTLKQTYDALAGELTERRRKAGEALAAQVTASLKELGMAGCGFRVGLSAAEGTGFLRYGREQVTFEIRTNAGQPFGPLARIASGGELSRISLAIQVAAADSTHIPTLVFDEADAGIGGGVAEVVGMKLRQLGRSHQVLCVTHLPQVASQAHHHLQVSKSKGGETTSTSVTALDRESRVQEVARMLGGMEITNATLNHAEEMVARAEAG
ncbi:MAG: DNA repair protein RecN [Ectothiorhodospiraceae bacterium]|nr:DNA repair protein RecN [Ectothiorhodospiraceae bacterium]